MFLVVTGGSAIPIWMEPQDGNNSDKSTFHKTVKKVREFQKQFKECSKFKWVADSALYSREKLLKRNDYLWLSRVPETITEAQELIEKPDSDIRWVEREKGYKTASFRSTYGGIQQRWLLIYSQKSYEREKQTFERKLAKQDSELEKLMWHLSNENFSCREDAVKSIKKIVKKFPNHIISFQVKQVKKYKK